MKDFCPACKMDMRASPVPEEHPHMYSRTHFMRWVGISDMYLDRMVKMFCPDCKYEEDLMKREGK